MNSNLFHNIINALIAVLAAMATMDWTIFFTPETATAIVGGLSALKLIINVVRDGFAGLVKEQPPVK